MGEFFKGWRRKCGVLTLVLACVFAAGWVRSKARFDVIGFPTQGELVRIASSDNSLWLSWDNPWSLNKVLWTIGGISRSDPNSTELWDGFDVVLRWDFVGFHFGKGTRDGNSSLSNEIYCVPYWSIVLPLTLLSAYLLLSQPRKPESVTASPAVPQADSKATFGRFEN